MRYQTKTTVFLALTVGLTLALAGCKKKKEDKGGDESAQAEGATQKDGEKGEKSQKDVEMVDYDLGPAGDKWKGWVAKAPKGMEVMSDLGEAVRIAEDGHEALDLMIAPKHEDLAELKNNKKTGASKSEKSSLEFTVDKKDALVWKSTYGDQEPSWHLAIHMTVDGRKITCANNHMRGLPRKSSIELAKKICKSMHKAGGNDGGDAKKKEGGAKDKTDKEKGDDSEK